MTSARARRRSSRLAAAVAGVLALTACAQTPAQTRPQVQPEQSSQQLTTQTAAPTASDSSASEAPTSAESTSASTGSTTAAECAAPPSGFVRQAPGEGKTVALTFDDGPAYADLQILKVLQRYDVKATFFETGANASENPDIVKALVDGGQLVADHSWDHQYPAAVNGGWTVKYLTSELTRTDDTLSAITGAPVCFYRPPGGYTDNVLKATAPLKLTAVMWSIDTEDWRQPSKTTSSATSAIVAAATKIGTQTHPIVLMHSGKASHEPDSAVSPNRSNTVAALADIIDWYQAKGFTFVRMDGVS